MYHAVDDSSPGWFISGGHADLMTLEAARCCSHLQSLPEVHRRDKQALIGMGSASLHFCVVTVQSSLKVRPGLQRHSNLTFGMMQKKPAKIQRDVTRSAYGLSSVIDTCKLAKLSTASSADASSRFRLHESSLQGSAQSGATCSSQLPSESQDLPEAPCCI